MWLGRRGEIPFGRLPKILPKMQKAFPRLCHSLLQGIPPRDLRHSAAHDVAPLRPIGLDGMKVGASPQGLAPSPHHGLPHTNDLDHLNPDLLLNASMATKPGSTVGGAPDPAVGQSRVRSLPGALFIDFT